MNKEEEFFENLLDTFKSLMWEYPQMMALSYGNCAYYDFLNMYLSGVTEDIICKFSDKYDANIVRVCMHIARLLSSNKSEEYVLINDEFKLAEGTYKDMIKCSYAINLSRFRYYITDCRRDFKLNMNSVKIYQEYFLDLLCIFENYVYEKITRDDLFKKLCSLEDNLYDEDSFVVNLDKYTNICLVEYNDVGRKLRIFILDDNFIYKLNGERLCSIDKYKHSLIFKLPL